jgi:hypothetical protein
VTTDQIERIEYFLTVPEMYVREWPAGLMRRTKLVGIDRTNDEAWTSNDRWEPTFYFIAPEFGSSHARFPLIEVPDAEAELIRQTMADSRPRGGPFTAAGQTWLAAHPQDGAAKYFGVTPPVCDRVGLLVTPMGPVPGESK